MQYNYILLADSRFISHAMSELKQRLGIEGRVKIMALGRSIYLANMDVPAETAFAKLRDTSFSYGVMPVSEIIQKSQTVEELTALAAKLVSKGEAFRLELVSLGARRGESAKTTEVKIGKTLEAQGFTVSLTAPQRIVYLIIGEGIVILATAKASELPDITIDHFRLEDKKQDSLNRAEVKIKEAFDVFGLWDKKIARCIDVGASPGGWTNFLVKRGASVVAIDKGMIDYEKLSTKDVKIVEDIKDYAPGHSVIHIKSNLSESAVLPFEKEGFDLLAIDINTDYFESSRIAMALSPFVKSGGFLIMTLKLPKIGDAGRIYMVNDALANGYKVERVKKLHHNRMELTLFATRL